MNDAIRWRRDAASAEQVADLLRRCDAGFVPPLSTRVELTAYAHKLVAHARRLEAWCGAGPVALLAMYCNDMAGRTAFITSMSVAPEYTRRGIASMLVGMAATDARAAGMQRIALEVDKENGPARQLYHKHGFRPTTSDGRTIRMSMELDEKGTR